MVSRLRSGQHDAPARGLESRFDSNCQKLRKSGHGRKLKATGSGTRQATATLGGVMTITELAAY